MSESRSLLNGLASRQPMPEAATLKVVAVYDGFITAVYANETVGSLTMSVRPLMHVESSVWSFDMLARLDLRHPAIRVTAEADVIIVAADVMASLPAHVMSWLMRSLQENDKGMPLIVVVHDEGCELAGSTPPLRADLELIAAQWGTPLLCNGEFDSRLDGGLAFELAGRHEPLGSVAELDDVLSSQPAGRWGINE